MNKPESPLQWFAVQTRPRYEKAVFQSLEGKDYSLLLPMYQDRRKWKYRKATVDVPLFPGYLFCRMRMEARLPILVTPGVVRIVSSGKTLLPVEDSEIESIRRVIAAGLEREPWPYVQLGEQIDIPSGPLRGLRGTVTEIRGKCRLIVSVTLLQRSIAVEIEGGWLRGMSVESPARGDARALESGIRDGQDTPAESGTQAAWQMQTN